MADEYADDYENVAQYTLDDPMEEELLTKQRELVYMWTTKAGEPVGVIQSFLYHEGKFWMTCAEFRKRVPAVRRDPRSAVCVTSTGTDMGPGKTVTYKGETIVHGVDDRETKDWFYRAFATQLWKEAGQEYIDRFVEYLDSPSRVVLEFIPGKRIGYDGAKMAAATRPVESEQ